MADDSKTSLEEAFHLRLLAAIAELRKCTRLGLRDISECIQKTGGLKAAQAELQTVRMGGWTIDVGDFFRAAKNAGRIDLSIEAIVLEPRWAPLFTQEELREAAGRLRKHGHDLPLPAVSETAKVTLRDWFSQLNLPDNSPNRMFFERLHHQNDCEYAAAQSAALHEGSRPAASRYVRSHLVDCADCRRLHADLAAAYDRFDQEALQAWLKLLENFEATLKLGDEHLKHFFLNEPEDFNDPEDYEAAFEIEMERVRPIFAWRAVRLGVHIARFMSAFTGTFFESGNLWLKWRSGKVAGSISDFVRRMDSGAFALGLAARNLSFVRAWPGADEDLLFLPSEGDLRSVPGLLQIDEVESDPLEEFEEVLGPPPQDTNLMGVFYLAYAAAFAEVQTTERTEVVDPSSEAVLAEMAGLREMVQAGFEAQQSLLDELRERQDAEIAQLERMVAYMSSTDRIACERVLVEDLGDVWSKLDPQVQCQLIGAQQNLRMWGPSAPNLAVHALASAFEVQVRRSIMAPLLAFLRDKKTPKLLPPPEWTDTEPNKHVYRPDLKADQLELGHMERLLRLGALHIVEYFDMVDLSLQNIHAALKAVLEYRNLATHVKRPFETGEAEAICKNWLRWGSRGSGVFAALFRSTGF